MHLCVIGNPENRRVRDFQESAVEMGMARPACITWLELIKEPTANARLSDYDLVRIESPGENSEVQHRLMQLGGRSRRLPPLEFGEIDGLHEAHLGFSEMLDKLANVETRFLNAPHDIATMFDKWQSHQRFTEAGIERPHTELAPMQVEEFRDFRQSFASKRPADSNSHGRVFLKPRFGSSASGVCAYRWSGDREQLIAPIEIERCSDSVRLFNSLHVRRYTSLQDIQAVLSRLLPQGMICERWIPKARLPDGRFDLRIVTINGEARHCVVRQSRHPMTNLHLGNRRGDIDEVRAQLGDNIVSEAREIAERAAACFPDSLYGGVDVIIDSRKRVRVCEINAFGDLLPNLLHRGESTYQSILRATAGTMQS